MERDLRWKDVGEAVARFYGLDFPPGRETDLQRNISAAAQDADLPLHEFARRLIAGILEPAEQDLLVARLTVGETYFFRDPELLEALRIHVLPGLLGRRADTRTLRIWSAGCCSGEEPYTIAMVLRTLRSDLDAWRLTIVGTDVNPGFLERARQGLFGAWSLRATPESVRRRYFTRQDDGRYRIDEALRAMVEFHPLNLNDDAYPPWLAAPGAVDLILCRNVLMYFESGRARQVAGRLGASLSPDGWLAVGSCESQNELFPALEPVQLGDATFYRQPQADGTARSALPASVDRARGSGGARASSPGKRTQLIPDAEPPQAEDPGAHARALADQGRLNEALATCEAWIGRERTRLEAHFLRALIALELGHAGMAAASLERCAYLAPGEPMVDFLLARLERMRVRPQRARQLYRHALDNLARRPADEVLTCTDGVTAAQMSKLIAMLLDQEVSDDRAA